MPIDFPNSPEIDDIFTQNSRAWIWNGTTWDTVQTNALVGPQGETGPQGPAGENGTFIEASTALPTSEDGNNGDLWIVYS